MEIPGYEIKGPLGRGGMGTVYLAFQLSLQREVAIKVMAPALAEDEEFSRRFLNEGRVIARLSHPNIVTVYDIGIHEHRHYLSMEYLPGGTLKRRIVEGITFSEVLRVIKSIAGALGYAHRAGFVHRDVKPQNILFRGDDTPVLTDFGIAKSVGAGSVMTLAGSSVGSPKYMSPEQARGQRVDSRSDLYALGVIFYEMLTGKLPYETEDPFAVALMHVSEPIPRLPERYAPFQPVLDRLLAKAADQRYADAGQVVAELTAVEDSLGPGDTVEMAAVLPGPVSWLEEDQTPEQQVGTPLVGKADTGQSPGIPDRPPPEQPPPVPVEPTIYSPTPLPPSRRRSGGRSIALWTGAAAVLGLLLAGWFMIEENPPLSAESRSLPPSPETPSPPAEGQAQAPAPEPPPPRESPRDLARQFREQAEALRDQNQLTAALEQVARGLSLGAGAAGDQHQALLDLNEALRADLAEQEQARQEAAEQQELAALLALAGEQRREGRLTSPEQDNAYASYQQVLERDPENSQALAGVAELAAEFQRQGQEWLEQGDRQAALEAVEQGLRIAPGDPRLLALRDQALAEAAPEDSQTTPEPPTATTDPTDPVQTLLGLAAAQELAGHLLEPAGDNARESYQAVLELDPDNAPARAALERLNAPPAITKAPEETVESTESIESIEPAPQPDAGDERSAQIAALQKRFDALVKSWNLTTGRQGHALGVLREIQKLDPRHPFIPVGRQRIALAYAALARSALREGKLDQAGRWLDAGDRVQQGLPQLQSLRTELAAAEAAARPPEPQPLPAPPPPLPSPVQESLDDIFRSGSNR